MTIRDLVESERRRILEEAVEILTEREDDEDVLRRFLPLAAHARSLSPHALVVVGERGAGKTALFRFLGALVRKGVPVGSVFRNVPGDLPWHEGFSEFGRDHPATAQVIGFASGASREDMRRFWFAHLVGRLGEWAGAQGVGPPEPFFLTWRSRRNEPHLWVAEASRQAGALQGWLDSLDADLSSRGDRVVVSYDHIDRLRDAGSPRLPERMGGELLALWLALGNRHRAIQGKVFLRHDLYQASLQATTDASKLRNRAFSLDWSREDLFRVLLRRLGAGDRVRAWMTEPPDPIHFEQDSRLGWMPPEALPESAQLPMFPDGDVESASQRDLARKLVGETMGTGANKGYTHRWIFNHVQDGRGRAVPRSVLNLVRFAAEEALLRGPRAGGRRLLTPSDLEGAQETTGLQRLEELKEEHPVAGRLEQLRGLEAPFVEAEVVAKLARPLPEGRPDDGYGSDGAEILDALVGLGALTRREHRARRGAAAAREGRIDAPELIRRALGIKRRGGPRQALGREPQGGGEA